MYCYCYLFFFPPCAAILCVLTFTKLKKMQAPVLILFYNITLQQEITMNNKVQENSLEFDCLLQVQYRVHFQQILKLVTRSS